jgi:hypothetical protein
MARKISHAKVLRRGYLELTSPGMSLLAFVSSLALAPACTFVVGERPREEDAGADKPLEQDAATEQEAGIDAGMAEDGGAALDATSPGDAGATDAAPVDAAAETGATTMEAGGADSAIVDAGPAPDCGSSAGMLWYPDGDDDGYGRSAEAVQTCGKPAGDGWVRLGNDCKDNDDDVRPGQTSYFGVPYRGADGNDSFDYDCSGSEEGNPSQSSLANGCDGILDILNCSGTGYMSEARTGAGVNPVCGSTKVGTCTPMLLSCTTAMQTDRPPYECK